MTIKHREPLGSISGGNFSLSTYKIQPGLDTSFPWLSQISQNFEYYHVNSMNFEFVSNLPTTSKGLVYLAIDYNAADLPVVDSANQIALYSGVQITKAFQQSKIFVQRDKTTKQRMRIRTLPSLPQNTAIQDYDIGSLLVVVEGNSDVGNIGHLFVNYDITLSVPQPSPNNDEANSFASELSLVNPTAPVQNIYNALTNGSLEYITQKIGQNISLKDGVFTFAKPGDYICNLQAKVANTITAMVQQQMMDAVKNLTDFGNNQAQAYIPDGTGVDTIEPVWTQIGTDYVTNIAFGIGVAVAGQKFAMGLANAATPWVASSVKRLSLSISPQVANFF